MIYIIYKSKRKLLNTSVFVWYKIKFTTILVGFLLDLIE